MSGWENNNNEPIVESVETIHVTEPSLYKQRAIQALNEHAYDNALKEAQMAINYGNHLEYKVLYLRCLFEAGRYVECLRFLQSSNLWRYRDSQDLLPDERNYIYYVRGVSHRESHSSDHDVNAIIVTPDGKGMCRTVQEAIERYAPEKEIFLTSGEYYENIDIFKDAKIRSKDILGECAIYGKIYIYRGHVSISNIELVACKQSAPSTALVSVTGGACNFQDVKLIGNGKDSMISMGIALSDCNMKCTIEDAIILNFHTGLYADCDRVLVKNCDISNNDIGINFTAKSPNKAGKPYYNAKSERDECLKIENCHFFHNRLAIYSASKKYSLEVINITARENDYAVYAQHNSRVFVSESEFAKNKYCFVAGEAADSRDVVSLLFVKDSEVLMGEVGILIQGHSLGSVSSCQFRGASKVAIAAINSGVCGLEKCIIEGNEQAYLKSDRGLIETTNVTEKNNSRFERIVESAKYTTEGLLKQ